MLQNAITCVCLYHLTMYVHIYRYTYINTSTAAVHPEGFINIIIVTCRLCYKVGSYVDIWWKLQVIIAELELRDAASECVGSWWDLYAHFAQHAPWVPGARSLRCWFVEGGRRDAEREGEKTWNAGQQGQQGVHIISTPCLVGPYRS